MAAFDGRPRVFLSHDGAIDELLALLLLALSPEIELVGVSCVAGDCLAEPAMEAQRRLLHLAGRPEIPQSLSAARAFNPFPWRYRADCVRFLALDELTQLPGPPAGPPYPDGEQHLREALEQAAPGGLTLLLTGPLTPLRLVLEREPALERQIARAVWMGGAIRVPGNLELETLPGVPTDGRAEWNVFWDPFAVDWIFRRTAFPLTLFPLDVSDQAPVRPDFAAWLEAAGPPAARLAAQAYALTRGQPMYRLWDTVAACSLLWPDLFAPPVALRLGVETWGSGQGALFESPAGREVAAALAFAPRGLDRFYGLIAERFAGRIRQADQPPIPGTFAIGG